MKELRNKIDAIDKNICENIKNRLEVASEIAEYKKENNLNVQDSDRERQVIFNVTGMVPEGMRGYIKAIYQTIFETSKSYQKKFIPGISKQIESAINNTQKKLPERAVVACQGIEGAFSQHAADKMFLYPSIMYFNSFDKVFSAVDKGLCQYGILPLENSQAGSVNAVYELMNKYKFYIVGSSKLFVKHYLMAKNKINLDKIKEIYSHEQAINQCSEFINSLKGVKVIECENTAIAAKKVFESDRNDICAICSEDCEKLYNLKIVSDDIMNTGNNYTRFICISKDIQIYPGAKKTSIMLKLEHKPGALYGAISKINALGLNLSKLESRPIAGSDFEFVFYFDIECSVYDERLMQLLNEFSMEEGFNYLGTYCEY